jgi:two-component system OmpR family response regulator
MGLTAATGAQDVGADLPSLRVVRPASFGATSPVEEEPAVALIRWPEQVALLPQLRSQHRPRLLLVDLDSQPPLVTDPLEDWVRTPVEERDLQARVATLAGRAGRGAAPTVDGRGRLRFRDQWVALSPIEYNLARVLIERFGEVVEDTALYAQAWGDHPAGPGALRVHVTRLRRRLVAMGLEIRAVRGQGYVLQQAVTQRAWSG